MNQDNMKEIFDAARAALAKTNVEHEKAWYGAWAKALGAELGLDPATGEPPKSETSS